MRSYSPAPAIAGLSSTRQPHHTWNRTSFLLPMARSLILILMVALLARAHATVAASTTASTVTSPAAQLTVTSNSGVAPLAVTFNASGSTQGSAAITQLMLSFGDGTANVTWNDKNQTQSHTFASSGTFNVTLTVSDANGSSATVPNTITATPPQAGACVRSPLPSSGTAIATFHSMSLYYNPPSAPGNNQVFVRYRLATDDPNASSFTWKQGHPLWYDARNDSSGQPLHPYRGRGSVVHLQPGTQFIFEVGTGADYATATWLNHIPGAQGEAAEPCPSTWNETFPVGTTLTPWTGIKTTTTGSSYLGSRSGSACARF